MKFCKPISLLQDPQSNIVTKLTATSVSQGLALHSLHCLEIWDEMLYIHTCIHTRVPFHCCGKKKKKNDLFPTSTTFSHKLYKFELYIQLEKKVNKKC